MTEREGELFWLCGDRHTTPHKRSSICSACHAKIKLQQQHHHPLLLQQPALNPWPISSRFLLIVASPRKLFFGCVHVCWCVCIYFSIPLQSRIAFQVFYKFSSSFSSSSSYGDSNRQGKLSPAASQLSHGRYCAAVYLWFLVVAIGGSCCCLYRFCITDKKSTRTHTHPPQFRKSTLARHVTDQANESLCRCGNGVGGRGWWASTNFHFLLAEEWYVGGVPHTPHPNLSLSPLLTLDSWQWELSKAMRTVGY